MIDKIVTLENKLSYYILDEYISDDGNKYIFGVQVDIETDIISNNYIFLKEITDTENLNDTFYDSITNDDEYARIGSVFIDRMSN